jgi:hypothetical protein
MLLRRELLDNFEYGLIFCFVFHNGLLSAKGSGWLVTLSGNTTDLRVASSAVLLLVAVLCSLEHYMPKLNSALFEPLKRIENACRRASNIMLNAPSLAPRENELIAREIQEIRDAMEAFKTAVEAGEMTGFQDSGIRSHGG